MSETASLVLKLDSTQVAKGSADLDKLSASAAKAERANAMLGASFKTSGIAAKDLLDNTNLSVTARARLTTQLEKQGVATGNLVKATVPLAKAHTEAAKSTVAMADGFERGEKSAANFVNTLTRRFILGFAISQIRNLAGAFGTLHAELAKTADVGRITGIGSQAIQGLQGAAAISGIKGPQFLDDMVVFSREVEQAKRGVGELAALLRVKGVPAATGVADAFYKVATLVKDAASEAQKFSILQAAGLPATIEQVRYMERGAEAIKRQAGAISGLRDDQLRMAQELDKRFNEMWDRFSREGKRAILAVSSSYESRELVAIGKQLLANRDGPDRNSYMKVFLNRAKQSGAASEMTANDASDFYSRFPQVTKEDSAKKSGPTPDEMRKDISREQQKLGAYGQTTTAMEARRGVELQLRLLGIEGVGIDKARADTLKQLAAEQTIGVTAIKASTDAANIEAATIGMSVGQTQAYTAAQNALNAAKRSGQKLSAESEAAIKAEADKLVGEPQFDQRLQERVLNPLFGPAPTFRR